MSPASIEVDTPHVVARTSCFSIRSHALTSATPCSLAFRFARLRHFRMYLTLQRDSSLVCRSMLTSPIQCKCYTGCRMRIEFAKTLYDDVRRSQQHQSIILHSRHKHQNFDTFWMRSASICKHKRVRHTSHQDQIR